MVTSTQKLLILTVAINVFLFTVGFMYNSNAYESRIMEIQMDKFQEQTDYWEDSFSNTNPDAENAQFENTFGDTKSGGKSIWSILVNGIRPIPSDHTNSTLEEIIINAVSWGRYLLLLIITLEIYLVLKNKKQT